MKGEERRGKERKGEERRGKERRGEAKRREEKRRFGLAIDKTVWVSFSLSLALVLGLLCDPHTSLYPPLLVPSLTTTHSLTHTHTRMHKHTQPAASHHRGAATDGLCMLRNDLSTGLVYSHSQTRLAPTHCLCVRLCVQYMCPHRPERVSVNVCVVVPDNQNEPKM